jgi:hypothetical protein
MCMRQLFEIYVNSLIGPSDLGLLRLGAMYREHGLSESPPLATWRCSEAEMTPATSATSPNPRENEQFLQ